MVNSVYSPAFYQSAPSRSLWAALRYFALLCLLTACLSVVASRAVLLALLPGPVQAGLNQVIELVPSDLELTFRNGMVQTNVAEPYVFALSGDDPGAPANRVVIDTKRQFSVAQLRAYRTRIWLTRDALISEDSSGRIKAIPLTRVPDGRYNRETLQSMVAEIAPWLRLVAPLVAVALLLVNWLAGAFRLLYLLPLALAIWLVGKRLALPWSYGQAYAAGVYAMTLGLLVGPALDLTDPWLHLHGFPFQFTALTVGVLAANLGAAGRLDARSTAMPAPVPFGERAVGVAESEVVGAASTAERTPVRAPQGTT
jgi:hypothetical protein